MVCLAPRALEDSVRPRRLAGASVRPLNFTVRGDAVPRNRVLAIIGAVILTLVPVAGVVGIFLRKYIEIRGGNSAGAPLLIAEVAITVALLAALGWQSWKRGRPKRNL